MGIFQIMMRCSLSYCDRRSHFGPFKMLGGEISYCDRRSHLGPLKVSPAITDRFSNGRHANCFLPATANRQYAINWRAQRHSVQSAQSNQLESSTTLNAISPSFLYESEVRQAIKNRMRWTKTGKLGSNLAGG